MTIFLNDNEAVFLSRMIESDVRPAEALSKREDVFLTDLYMMISDGPCSVKRQAANKLAQALSLGLAYVSRKLQQYSEAWA